MNTISLSSDIITSSSVIRDGKSYLTGVLVVTDGTNNATVTIYDNASAASGKVLYKTIISGSDLHNLDSIDFPVKADSGIYADISVATGSLEVIVYYM